MKINEFEGDRIVTSNFLESKFAVLTNDFGCIKEGFNGGTRKLTNFKNHFYGEGHRLFAIRVKHNYNVEVTAWNIGDADQEFSADGLMYGYECNVVPSVKRPHRLLPAVIGSTTGDCPHLIFEAKHGSYKSIGMTHISWLNAMHDMPGRTMFKVQQMGYPLKSVRLVLWSGLCVRCNEVDEPVREALLLYPKHFHPGRDEDHWQLDLAGVILEQLDRAGIKPGQIQISNICPCCYRDADDQPLFFSYRRHYFNPQKEMRRNGILFRV